MAIRDIQAIKNMGTDRLNAAFYSPRKLALIHVSVSLGVSLSISLLDILLSRQIGNTGGLSGLGMRSVLETIRTMLQYVISLGLPFWEMGFLFAAIRMARGEANAPATLLEGFRKFGPVLRLRILRGILYAIITLICIYLASFIFFLSPLAQPLADLLEPILMADGSVEQVEEMLTQLPMEQIQQLMWPIFAIGGALMALILVPLHYRFRLADFIVMDEPRMGGIMALIKSAKYMRRNRWKWFRLELSFWWYYGILVIAALVSYADMLLPAVGISLPVSEDAAWIGCYVLGLLVQFFLGWSAQSRVQTTYAVAYDILRQQEPEPPAPNPNPQNMPWDNYYTE